MKKLALALIASTVVAGATQANIGTGFYVGAHGGYGATTAKLSAVNTAGATAGQTVPGSVDVGGNAANIGVHGGYGWVNGCLYFGGEVAYTFENTKINNNFGSTGAFGSLNVKRNGYFRAALRGGYLFTPNTMLVIGLGGNWGKWTITDQSASALFNIANPGRGSKNRLSFAPSAALETAVHKNVYLRLEYTYEFGPSVRATSSTAGFTSGGTTVSKINTQSAKIGLSYKF